MIYYVVLSSAVKVINYIVLRGLLMTCIMAPKNTPPSTPPPLSFYLLSLFSHFSFSLSFYLVRSFPPPIACLQGSSSASDLKTIQSYVPVLFCIPSFASIYILYIVNLRSLGQFVAMSIIQGGMDSPFWLHRYTSIS